MPSIEHIHILGAASDLEKHSDYVVTHQSLWAYTSTYKQLDETEQGSNPYHKMGAQSFTESTGRRGGDSATTEAQTRRHATNEEWDQKRPVITHLYQDEGRTLEDVMTVMADKHNFHATYGGRHHHHAL